ncbi:hypothetical protein D7Z96_19485 [Pseudarthrobacter phenanthrenivorans]|uniref:Uncharacterized protein n=1 Tax=Pseudarthrobacter phenanthrenivorans TaxID=361575 RepID=A0A3B0F4A6_PSEPS|nr:hypothetical protein D7Z96_19485 [Pseudarthrobacter phenanthrenivorans]
MPIAVVGMAGADASEETGLFQVATMQPESGFLKGWQPFGQTVRCSQRPQRPIQRHGKQAASPPVRVLFGARLQALLGTCNWRSSDQIAVDRSFGPL